MSARGLREEIPFVAKGDDALRVEAERVARIILDEGLAMERGMTLGVYGGRGTGKTTFLLTLLDVLRELSDTRGDPHRSSPRSVGLPTNYERGDFQGRAGLFTPAEYRIDDDLLFALLGHIQAQYGLPSGAEKKLEAVLEAEVRRRRVSEFVEYEKALSASVNTIPDRVVKVYQKAFGSTAEMRRSLDEVLGDRPRVLFIDDLDLQPQRALDLLETLQFFFARKGVVIVIAADRELLLRSIQQELRTTRRFDLPSLAPALLQKYVPYNVNVPVPSPRRRVEVLLETHDGAEQVLGVWWPSVAERSIGTHEKTEHAPRESQHFMRKYLGSVLPAAHRQIRAVYNRLVMLGAAPGADEVRFHERLYERIEGVGLPLALVAPFVSLVVALDVRFPELMLYDAMLRAPSKLAEFLGRLAPQATERDEGSKKTQALAFRAARQAAYVQLPDEPEPELLDALLALALAWRDFAGATVRSLARERMLPISLDADAMERSRVYWGELHDAARVAEWHIDLRGVAGDSPRGSREALLKAQEEVRRAVERNVVKGFGGTVLLHLHVPLPFALWLGWELRYVAAPEVLAVSRDLDLRRYVGPPGVIRPRGFSLALLRVESDGRPEEDPRETHFAVIVDLIGSSRSEQVAQFWREGVRVNTPVGERVLRDATAPIEPDDLDAVLVDLVEYLGGLRERGVVDVHLGFAGHVFVAFFLGRQLNAFGLRLHLYNWSTSANRYEYVFDLEE